MALQVNEGSHRQVFYFGQVESDEILLRSMDQVLDDGFPIGIDWNNKPWQCQRMMLKKVKWLRRAVARDLPGNRMSAASQKNVAWLLETFSPF